MAAAKRRGSVRRGEEISQDDGINSMGMGTAAASQDWNFHWAASKGDIKELKSQLKEAERSDVRFAARCP